MKLPSRLKVGAHTYTVELTKAKDAVRHRDNWGKAMIEEKRILLDRELPESQLEETFFHELLHVCMHASGIGYDIYDKVQLTEEQVVTRLAPWVHHVLIDNGIVPSTHK